MTSYLREIDKYTFQSLRLLPPVVVRHYSFSSAGACPVILLLPAQCSHLRMKTVICVLKGTYSSTKNCPKRHIIECITQVYKHVERRG